MTNDIKDFASRLKSIIDTAIDGIITINQDGIVETINYSALEMFGYQEDEVVGKNINRLMPSPYKSQHDTYIANYLKTKTPNIIGLGREVKGQKKDGTIFPFRLAVSEVKLQDRVVFTGIIHDLTNIKKAQERILSLNKRLEVKVTERTYELESVVNELLRTNKKLKEEVIDRLAAEEKLRNKEEELTRALEKEKELGELKSRFVSMASHEFRTPLATILSSVSLIARYKDVEGQSKREKHIGRIKNAVDNLTGILNDFLSLSKLEEGAVHMHPVTIDMQELVGQIQDEIEGILKVGQSIKVTYLGISERLYHDPRILKNIFFNLLSNAVKYSGENNDIEFNIKFVESQFEVEIKDYGIGIPEEDKKYMFQRFFRAGNVTNIQGTGLGLTIVKRYVDLLGGSVTFESTYGIGTSFFIKLPNHV